MKTLLLTILGATIANILTWAISQGFQHSYWGRNIVQELTRFINSFCKHYQKMKKNNDTNKDL